MRQARVRLKKKLMFDSGISTAFITHQVAEELNFERINPVRLTIRIFADTLVISTWTKKEVKFTVISNSAMRTWCSMEPIELAW